MILVVAGNEVLELLCPGRMDIRVLKLIEIPRRCVVCSKSSLVRHGVYWRKMKKNGITSVLPIQRVCCRKCHSSFSCLYDFLIPYQPNCQTDLIAVVEHHLSQFGTGVDRRQEESFVHKSTVSRVFTSFLENVGEAFTQLASLALKSGVNPLAVAPVEVAHAHGSDRKRNQIRLAVSLLNLARHLYRRGEGLLKEICDSWLKKFQKQADSGLHRRPGLSRAHKLQNPYPCSIFQSRFKTGIRSPQIPCQAGNRKTREAQIPLTASQARVTLSSERRNRVSGSVQTTEDYQNRRKEQSSLTMREFSFLSSLIVNDYAARIVVASPG